MAAKDNIKPILEERGSSVTALSDVLYHFECRQAKLSYAGKFWVELNLQYNDGAIVREKLSLGQLPVMLKVWNSDVQFYRVNDSSGSPIAYFYFDPYSRPSEKRGGAWMDEVVGRTETHLLCPLKPRHRHPSPLVLHSPLQFQGYNSHLYFSSFLLAPYRSLNEF